jgi:hypothetical protein
MLASAIALVAWRLFFSIICFHLSKAETSTDPRA